MLTGLVLTGLSTTPDALTENAPKWRILGDRVIAEFSPPSLTVYIGPALLVVGLLILASDIPTRFTVWRRGRTVDGNMDALIRRLSREASETTRRRRADLDQLAVFIEQADAFARSIPSSWNRIPESEYTVWEQRVAKLLRTRFGRPEEVQFTTALEPTHRITIGPMPGPVWPQYKRLLAQIEVLKSIMAQYSRPADG